MHHNQRKALRAAVLIHEHASIQCLSVPSVHLPEYAWATMRRLQGQIVRAAGRGWQRAVRRLSTELADVARRFQMDLETARHAIESQTAPRIVPTPSEIYRDILAIQEEFDEVEIDLDEHELSVTTDSIVLEGIELGRFDIRLDWQRLGGLHAYRIVARDPNPAAQSDEVTHPHVQSETLCEGEGRVAIRAAMAQYRIYDLMLLISQVLHTYARGSAYVELDAWTGISCKDCGITMSPDDSYGCQRCGSELCDDCRHSCAACEESHCSGCLSCCPECEMEFCRGCMEVCPDCHRKVCCQCMEDGLCPSCREKQFQEEKDEHDADDDKSTDRAEGYPDGQAGTGEPSQEASRAEDVAPGKTEPDAAVEPDCLGEALVPA
jgi:hypothetical protein